MKSKQRKNLANLYLDMFPQFRYVSSKLKNNDYNLPLISISYYLDENKKDYVETSSGQELIDFVKSKLISLDDFNDFIIKEGNQLDSIHKAIKDKNIDYMYELLFSNVYLMYFSLCLNQYLKKIKILFFHI